MLARKVCCMDVNWLDLTANVTDDKLYYKRMAISAALFVCGMCMVRETGKIS
jgi:hypothetical protein